jgi:uncharacterized protein (TIGR03437 family)
LYWKDETTVVAEYNGIKSNAVSVSVRASDPGILTADSSGFGQGRILNEDLSVNSTSNPARHGSLITLYVTGEGQTDPAGIDGLAVSAVARQPRLPVSVTIGGLSAAVAYVRPAIGLEPGLMEVAARVPADVPVGSAVPVQVTIGSASAAPGVTLAVESDVSR